MSMKDMAAQMLLLSKGLGGRLRVSRKRAKTYKYGKKTDPDSRVAKNQRNTNLP